MEGWFILPPFTAALAIVLSISALLSDHWTSTPTEYSGLWSECYFNDESQKWICGDAEWDHPHWILAVKVLVIMSVSFGLLTTIAAVVAFTSKSAQWSRGAFFVIILQMIILAVGLFVFLAYVSKFSNRSDLAWSYMICWISMGFYLLSLIFFGQQTTRLGVEGQYDRIDGSSGL